MLGLSLKVSLEVQGLLSLAGNGARGKSCAEIPGITWSSSKSVGIVTIKVMPLMPSYPGIRIDAGQPLSTEQGDE